MNFLFNLVTVFILFFIISVFIYEQKLELFYYFYCENFIVFILSWIFITLKFYNFNFFIILCELFIVVLISGSFNPDNFIEFTIS